MAYYIMFIAVVGLILLAIWHSRTSEYICKNCNNKFELSALQDFTGLPGVTTKYVKCPKCSKRTWAKVIKK